MRSNASHLKKSGLRQTRYGSNDLLSNNTQLFFIDLRNILNKNWDKFSNVLHDFEKVKFLMILDDLNKYRVDAHAKDIDETDFKQIRIYFDKLESLLES